MDDVTWKLINRKVVAHIYMAVLDKVLGDIKGLASGHEVWSKLKTMYDYVRVKHGSELSSPYEKAHRCTT